MPRSNHESFTKYHFGTSCASLAKKVCFYPTMADLGSRTASPSAQHITNLNFFALLNNKYNWSDYFTVVSQAHDLAGESLVSALCFSVV